MVCTHMMDTDCTVSKEAAVRMGSAASIQSLLGKKCVASFRTAGLFLLSLPSMTRCLNLL
uniref:AlNc14C870G12590 protein n=1 Tax=Albugo laibachii Nc14 TaxID=890382 RepID=F0X273_9STRA|nr:AlNc14C870G12590 [Albugo laibachii Nc14]|eukprot:CCA27949.1 AlNc14C870G12590 [Albugo laibachii Nc14]